MPGSSPTKQSADQLLRLEAALARLLGEWEEVRSLAGLGAGTTGSKIQALLGVDRGTAQRLVRIGRLGQVTLDDLEAIPGTAAWAGVLVGVERALGETHPNARRFAHAIDQFASSIEAFGGSRAAAVRAVREAANTPRDDKAEEARRSLAESFASLLGFSIDARLSVVLYRPQPDHPEVMDEAMLMSLLGCRGVPGSHPLTLRRFRTRDGSALATSSAEQDARRFFLLRAGTSSPPPEILTAGNEQSQVVMVEPNWSERVSSLSVTSLVVDRGSGGMPWDEPPPILEVETLNRYPTRRLALVYLVHETIARGASASFGPFGDRRVDGLGRPWFDRIPDQTELRRTDAPFDLHSLPEIPQSHAILSEMFERLGWDAGEFVAYLAVVDDPIPLARYVFTMQWPD